MDKNKRNIGVIGIGGGGGNTLHAILGHVSTGLSTMVINRDKRSVRMAQADRKLVISGDTPSEIFLEVNRLEADISPFIHHCSHLVLLACMGGMAGSYAVAPVASIAQKLATPTIAIITTPFDFEGDGRMAHARSGKERLEATGVTTAVFPNQQLMEIAGDKSMEGAFDVFNAEVVKMIQPMLNPSSSKHRLKRWFFDQANRVTY